MRQRRPYPGNHAYGETGRIFSPGTNAPGMSRGGGTHAERSRVARETASWIERFLCGLGILVSAGCAAPSLNVNDAVVGPDGRTLLVAYLEREPLRSLRKGVEDATIEFRVAGQPIGTATTDKGGRASIDCRLGDTSAEAFGVASKWGGDWRNADGRLFVWRAGRTAIAVDIDKTVCATDRDHLYFKTRDDSPPLPGSRAVLSALATEYDILYLTSRPRSLYDKTRTWLHTNGFPDGPIVTASGWRTTFLQKSYKQQTLARLREHLPTLLIGIGDREGDAEAYTANGMLALRIGKIDEDFAEETRGAAVVAFRDWFEIRRYFEERRAVLADPDCLCEWIAEGGFRESDHSD